MTMTPRLSKAVLTSHITFSVGWLGAVVVFLILAITGLTSQDIQTSRAFDIFVYRNYSGNLDKVGVIQTLLDCRKAFFDNWIHYTL